MSILTSRAAAVKLVRTSDGDFDKIRSFGLRDTSLLDHKTLQKRPRMKFFSRGHVTLELAVSVRRYVGTSVGHIFDL